MLRCCYLKNILPTHAKNTEGSGADFRTKTTEIPVSTENLEKQDAGQCKYKNSSYF